MRAFCLAVGLVLASVSLSSADEKWAAASSTANSVTGDITIVGGDTIVFANGDSMTVVPVAGKPGVFAVDPPVDPAPFGNPLCGRGSPLTRVKLTASGGNLSMEVFDKAGFCGQYNYESAASMGDIPDFGPDRGSVLWAQQKLNALGYDAGAEDGDMGPRTRAALAAFQRDSGLAVTSRIDPATATALDNPGEWDAAVPSDEPSPSDAPAGDRIPILGKEYPIMPTVRENDIRAEWADVKPYIPEWLLAAPDEAMDDVARVRLLEDLAHKGGAAYEAAIQQAVERNYQRFLKESPGKSREQFEFLLAELCLANDSGGYLPQSALALCQEHLALQFLIYIVYAASGVDILHTNPDPSMPEAAAVAPEPAAAAAVSVAPQPQKVAVGAQSASPAVDNKSEPLSTFKDCELCPEMVVLPAGSYWMGATDEDRKLGVDEYTLAAELPRHEVTFDYSFAIGKFEVTVAQFAAFVDETGFKAWGECTLAVPTSGPNKGKFIGTINPNAAGYQGWPAEKWLENQLAIVEYADFRTPGTEVTDRHPAACISRNEAKAYLAWLSEKSGRKYRFPTESEWEYAVRAGETLPFYYGGGQEELCEYGNFADLDSVYLAGRYAKCAETPSLEYTTPAGSFKPNNWGLHDMVGNVFEYVADCAFPNYDGAPADGSPWLVSEKHPDRTKGGRCLVWGLRGYDFSAMDLSLRSAARCGVYTDEDARSDALGLRVAVSMSDGAWDRQ